MIIEIQFINSRKENFSSKLENACPCYEKKRKTYFKDLLIKMEEK